MQARQPALDGLRGLAVLLVFCYHYGGGAASRHPLLHIIGEINKAGWIGVTLFFVLSGFLITGILWDSFRDPRWARKFYTRRVLRIFPLYYGALLLVLIGAACAGTLQPALRTIWIPVLFLQNLPGLNERVQELRSPLLLHHFWSLAVEEQFYLVWPALLWLQKSGKQAARLCIAVFLLSIAFRCAMSATAMQTADWTGLLPARAGELAAGGWLALAYRSEYWEVVQRWTPWTFAAAAVALAATSLQNGSAELTGVTQLVLGLTAATIASAALLALILSAGSWQRVMSMSWLRSLGRISFGIYVFHILLRPVYWRATHALVPVSGGAAYFVTRFIVAAIATVLVSWLSYRLYESLFLRLKSRYSYVTVDAGS